MVRSPTPPPAAASAVGPDTPLFLAACRGAVGTRPPVWIMRQAGRYLPEYRAVRARADFLEVCRSPELACEVTLQPLARFALDAAIVFSDIMLPLEAMGVQLTFDPGPVVAKPIRDAAAVAALRLPAAGEIAPSVMGAIRLLRRELKVPLIGFAGAPLTLAAYLVEGRGAKDFSRLRAFIYAEPAAAAALLDRLGEAMAQYLLEQVAAGAQAVQLFDTWAGALSEADYRRMALPAVQAIMRALKHTGVPRIYFAPHAAHLAGAVAEVDAEVFGVDWRTGLGAARAAFGPRPALQGNLDPAALFAPPAVVAARTRDVLVAARGPHIFNLGHGILPETPIASVHALLAAVHSGA